MSKIVELNQKEVSAVSGGGANSAVDFVVNHPIATTVSTGIVIAAGFIATAMIKKCILMQRLIRQGAYKVM